MLSPLRSILLLPPTAWPTTRHPYHSATALDGPTQSPGPTSAGPPRTHKMVAQSQSGVNMVRSMWLFKHKFHANGTLSRYKARLDANGSSQQQGIDVDDTFSSVVKPATIRTVLSLAVSRKWPIHQLDVKNAFLNGNLSETVYMHQPPGFTDPQHPNHVCLLQRSLYGLKQAPRAWFQRFAGYAIRAGFYHSRCDTSLFIYQQGFQKKYACELLEHANMVNCNPLRTAVDTDSKLGPEGICLYMHDRQEPHFAAFKHILWYVRGTVDFNLQLYASATTSLVGYTDADWAGCPSTRCSTFGYYVFLGDNLLSWSSKRQHTISRSSAEAKYRGVANVVAETAWLRNLLRELHSPLYIASLVYCDNVCAVYLSANPVQQQRTKHNKIDIHFVCDMVQTGHIRVLHVPSRYQYVVIFTNGLPTALFQDFHSRHFVDSNWRLQKRVLSFIHLPHPRRGTDIVDNLYKCFKYWSIENKVFTISVDNASNNDKAIKNLTETFSRIKKLPCGDLRCKMTVAKFIFPRMYSGDELKVNIKIVVDALSELYKEYVSEYYSSVASEATFSAGSRVIDTYRASLAPETVEVLLCGGDWCRSLHGLKRKNK
nr:ribonuclease H-like domain-containing protein [Tanacetum cinerariifolium]